MRGQLLIAGPTLLDPNFHRTVVLVVEHEDEGAMGLVLNRPSPIPLLVKGEVHSLKAPLKPHSNVTPGSDATNVNVGVLSFVTRSLEEVPLSLAAVRTGADGAVGAVVSTVMVVPAEAGPMFPATSVAVAVSVCAPSESVLEVIE